MTAGNSFSNWKSLLGLLQAEWQLYLGTEGDVTDIRTAIYPIFRIHRFNESIDRAYSTGNNTGGRESKTAVAKPEVLITQLVMGWERDFNGYPPISMVQHLLLFIVNISIAITVKDGQVHNAYDTRVAVKIAFLYGQKAEL